MKIVLVFMLFIFCSSCTTSALHKAKQVTSKQDILVIGHRGASGYRPEHTLEAYQLAIDMGADFIEPDLVSTKDHVLIARHENEISGTTDVAKKFPHLKKTKTIDGVKITGWFTEDLTLKEIKTLRAKERLANRDQSYNYRFEIPTFAEVLRLAHKNSQQTGRSIGVYPETKHPSYFTSIKLPLEKKVAEDLKEFGWDQFNSPVILQSFELSSLLKLKKLVNCRLVFLYEESHIIPYDNILSKDSKTYGDYTKPDELQKLGSLIYGIGPYKRLIVPEDKHKNLLPPTTLVIDAHKAGLKVHPYTFRSDNPYLSAAYGSDPKKEYFQFFELGVDGVFSDFSQDAVQARKEWLEKD